MSKLKQIYNWCKANDKLAHTIVEGIIAQSFWIYFIWVHWIIAVVLSFITCAVIGFVKETIDEITPNGTGWDWKDIMADGKGWLIGIWIDLIIYTIWNIS